MRDDQLDRALEALGAADPPPAMEARILARLADTPAARQTRPWAWWQPALVAVSCALLVAIAVAAHHLPRPKPRVVAARQPAVPPRSVEVEAPVRVAAAAPARLRSRPVSSPGAPEAPHPDRGLADLPSMPAPSEAITRQEHLLARAAHGPTPEDLALLNPETRDLLARQSAAEFNKFFPPATPQEVYLATHLAN